MDRKRLYFLAQHYCIVLQEEIVTIFYVCNFCSKKRFVKVNHSYHIAKSSGGLTRYNDYHLCTEDRFLPTIISVDKKYNVRSQKSGGSDNSSSKLGIPQPKTNFESKELLNHEEFDTVFESFEVSSDILRTKYSYGELGDNPYRMTSPTGLYTISFALNSNYEQYIENIKTRIEQLMTALDIGKNIDLVVISTLVGFIAEHADLPPDYVDEQICIDMTLASTIWMGWTNEFSGSYVDRHLVRLFGAGGMQIARKIMPYYKEGKYSQLEVAQETGLNIASVVSIAFMMELWGVVRYVYKDDSLVDRWYDV